MNFDRPHAPRSHARITHVGIGNNGKMQNRLTTSEVVLRIESGLDEFYTYEDGTRARVEVCKCGQSNKKHIRTEPDASRANNLESLDQCPLRY